MKPLNFIIKKYYRKISNRFFKILNELISPVEKHFLKKSSAPKFAPVFIVGPARSGTTLIYQALLKKFETSYFSNLAAKFFKVPLASTYVLQKLGLKFNDYATYKSNYGHISGLAAPSQSYPIWRRWFPRGMHKGPKNEEQRTEMVRTVGGIEQKFQAPFANKWPAFSVYIPELVSVFPNAFFIRVTREYNEVAKSVLKGRRTIHHDATKSISQLPDNALPYQNLSPVKQVCAYVLGIESQISQDLLSVDEVRQITVSYEDFCKAPNKFLKEIGQKYEQANKAPLKIRDRGDLEPFSISTSKKVSDEEAKEIENCITEFLKEQRFPHLPKEYIEE